MPLRSFGFMMANALVLTLPLAAAAQTVPPGNAGVYVLNSQASVQPLPTAAFSSSYIDGMTLVFYWNAVEPQDGIFNWSAIDSQIAAAAALGKKVNLGVLPGVFSPSWLYADGVTQYSMMWTTSGWGFPLCSMVPFPVPWDPIYQSKWLAFIQQLGLRYGKNSSVAMVKIQGVNSSTPEVFLPYTRLAGTGPGPGGCQQVDYVAEWLSVGYAPVKIINTWQKFAKNYVKYFPTQFLIMETGSWPLPPIDNNGVVTSVNDWHTANSIISAGARLAGSRFVIENDALSAVWNWSRPTALPSANQFAYQTAWNVDSDPTCRMNGYTTPCDPATVMGATVSRALAANVSFLEVYSSDAQDAAEATALTQAHDTLTGVSP